MLWLAILIGVVGLSLCTWSIARGAEPIFYRIFNGIGWLAGSAVICLVMARICRIAAVDWMGGKLAPILGITKNVSLYQDPTGGVMTGWIYGPVGALVMLPAALGKTPTTCGLIGSTIAFLCYIVPSAWLLWLATGRRFSALMGIALVIVGLLPMVSEDLMSLAFLAAPDAPAVGLAACACAALLLRRNTASLIIAALAAVLAIWSKQNYALLIAGLIAWVWLEDGWQGAAAFAGIVAAVGLAVATILIPSFGAANMWYHMVALPASHPFKYGESGLFVQSLINIRSFFVPLASSIAMLALLFLLDQLVLPAEHGLRKWFVLRRWPMLMIVTLSLLPGGFVGMAKVGGGYNSLAGVHYFLTLCVLCGVLFTIGQSDERAVFLTRTIQAGLSIVAFMLTVQGIFDPPTKESSVWSNLAHPYDNSTEQVYEYAAKHKEQVFCPWNPLITLLSDDKLYHFESGFLDRTSGHQPISTSQLVNHLPAKCTELIYADQPQSRNFEMFLGQFPNVAQRPELPNAVVFTR